MADVHQLGRPLTVDGEIDRVSEEMIEQRGHLRDMLAVVAKMVRSHNVAAHHLRELRRKVQPSRKAA